LRRIDGVDVVLAGGIWSTSVSNLLNPIAIDQTGAYSLTTYVKTGTLANGTAALKTANGQCIGWTYAGGSGDVSYDGFSGSSGTTGATWINNGSAGNPGAYSSCYAYSMGGTSLYCIEQ